MDGFQRRKEEKQARIYQAALELFGKYGVKNVKISEIAAKADVSPVTIYNYYGSKDGLLRKVIFQFMEEKGEEYSALIHKDIPFPEKIEKIIFNKKETAKGLYPEFIQSVVSKDPEIKKFVEDFYKNKSLPMVMEIIEQGRREGYINNNISNETILFYMGMFWEVVNRPELFLEENKSIQLELSELFFYGIVGPGWKKS